MAEIDDKVDFQDFTFVVKEVDGARITKLEIIKQVNEENREEDNIGE